MDIFLEVLKMCLSLKSFISTIATWGYFSVVSLIGLYLDRLKVDSP